MLFRRRTRESLLQRFRVHLWPRRSLGRSAQYFWKRILRLRATPHAIAAGVAAGAFAAFLPFLGLHILIAAALAWVIARQHACRRTRHRGGRQSAELPADLGGDLCRRPFPAACRPGASSAGMHIGSQLRHMDFAALWHPVLEPMTVGGVPLGIVAGAHPLFPNSRRRIGLPQRQAGASGRARQQRRPRAAANAAGLANVIIGIGSDLIDIRRIERSLERYGERFIVRLFTDVERASSERGASSAPPPTPSASRPRRPAPRRWAPACRTACSGATWASSTCPAASRPCSSPTVRQSGSRKCCRRA